MPHTLPATVTGQGTSHTHNQKSLLHSLLYTHTHTQTHADTHTYARMHARTHKHIHSSTAPAHCHQGCPGRPRHTHTHAHTHAHTHSSTAPAHCHQGYPGRPRLLPCQSSALQGTVPQPAEAKETESHTQSAEHGIAGDCATTGGGRRDRNTHTVSKAWLCRGLCHERRRQARQKHTHSQQSMALQGTVPQPAKAEETETHRLVRTGMRAHVHMYSYT